MREPGMTPAPAGRGMLRRWRWRGLAAISRATTFSFAGVFPFAAVVAAFTAPLAFAGVLALTGVLIALLFSCLKRNAWLPD